MVIRTPQLLLFLVITPVTTTTTSTTTTNNHHDDRSGKGLYQDDLNSGRCEVCLCREGDRDYQRAPGNGEAWSRFNHGNKKKPFLPPKSAFIYFLIFMEIFGRLQYRLCLLILGFYRVSIYINVSLGDVFVVCVFWKVLTSLKSIYPSSSTSIRRVMPCLSRCFSVPKFVSQRIQPRWFRVQLLQNPAFNYAYKSLGRKFPKQRSGIGERFFVNR